LTRQLKAIENR